MPDLPFVRRRGSALSALLAAFALAACADSALTGPQLPAGEVPMSSSARQAAPDVRPAIAAQERHTTALMRNPGVVGTAVGLLADGTPAVQVLVARPDVAGVPAALDDIPVQRIVTGLVMAQSDPTTRVRPAPLGFSVGHPLITAGTIGARVVDGSGNVYVLSNNHVLANSNNASLGDAMYQPGPADGGTSSDQIGTLAAFKPIDFSSNASNTMDAAIARTTTAELGNATPTDDAYGTPSSFIFGDANADGVFDDKSALLGLAVQKYGRTTKRTTGTITGINATISICYEVVVIFCTKSARFVDQLLVTPGGFSGGGDSGSLIVTNDAGKNPVALLFAGSSSQTIANRIDLVLSHFGVSIDGDGSVPPPPPPPPPPPSAEIHVGDLDVVHTSNSGTSWSATVEITVHDAQHTPINGATVVGSWSPNSAFASTTCTTGSGGGTGTCIVLNATIKKNLKSVTFSVSSVTAAGQTYASSANHDPDGGSNGTSIKANRP